MDFFHVNGVRIAASVIGAPDARPLILLHALGEDKSSWNPIAPAFAATHRVYAIDLRGFGDSDRPGKYSFEAMRDDVLGLLDVIGADRADVVGHSMGGSVACLIAEAQPGRVARLVLEDSLPPRRGMRRTTALPEPPAEPPFDWDAVVAIRAQLDDPDPGWWDRLSVVTAPTLLLAGGASSHVRQDLFAEAAAMLPDGQVAEIPVGHNIHLNAPDQFLGVVRPFLAT